MLRTVVEIGPGGNRLRAKTLATANVTNISILADISDYEMTVTEEENPVAGTPAWTGIGHVWKHDRRSSVWELIAKVAIWAARNGKRSAKLLGDS